MEGERKRPVFLLGQLLSIASIDSAGRGWAPLDGGGRIIVDGALPGDRLRAVSATPTRGGVRLLDWELVEPCADRVEPPCPVAAACGGCRLMGLSEDGQARVKLEMVTRALAEQGLEAELESAPRWWASPERLGSRNRVRMKVTPEGSVGFFNASKHERCVALEPSLLEAISWLRELAEIAGRPLAAFSSLEVRGADLEGRPSYWLRGRGDASASVLSEALRSLRRLIPGALFAVEGVDEPRPAPRYRRGGVRTPLGTFLQVNHAVSEMMVASLVAGARRRSIGSFADICCGSGNLSLPLASAGLAGFGVERDPWSLSCFQSELEALGASGEGIQLEVGDADEVIEGWLTEGRRAEVVIIDPPRRGLGQTAAKASLLSRRWLVFCSCSPVSFARDLRMIFTEHDGAVKLEGVELYDMFPQTHHVEIVAWMTLER